jgi:hypothetical protein
LIDDDTTFLLSVAWRAVTPRIFHLHSNPFPFQAFFSLLSSAFSSLNSLVGKWDQNYSFAWWTALSLLLSFRRVKLCFWGFDNESTFSKLFRYHEQDIDLTPVVDVNDKTWKCRSNINFSDCLRCHFSDKNIPQERSFTKRIRFIKNLAEEIENR